MSTWVAFLSASQQHSTLRIPLLGFFTLSYLLLVELYITLGDDIVIVEIGLFIAEVSAIDPRDGPFGNFPYLCHILFPVWICALTDISLL